MIELQFDARRLQQIIGPLHGFPKEVDKAVRSAIRRGSSQPRRSPPMSAWFPA